MKMNRRELLKGVALTSGAAFMGAMQSRTNTVTAPETLSSLPSPGSSGIEHIVVVTMENRSFDHLLGWLPNGDGKQAGLTYMDTSGVSHPTHSLSGDYTG